MSSEICDIIVGVFGTIPSPAPFRYLWHFIIPSASRRAVIIKLLYLEEETPSVFRHSEKHILHKLINGNINETLVGNGFSK